MKTAWLVIDSFQTIYVIYESEFKAENCIREQIDILKRRMEMSDMFFSGIEYHMNGDKTGNYICLAYEGE